MQSRIHPLAPDRLNQRVHCHTRITAIADGHAGEAGLFALVACAVLLLSSFANAHRRGRRRGHPVELSSPARLPADGRAGERGARGDVPDDRVGGEGLEPAAGILRPRDLAGEPVSVRRDRAGDAQRPARAGHRAVHAGHRERTRRCSIPSIRCRRCRNRPSSSPSCATSSAISVWRPPPTMPARAGCRNGSPAPVRCRRRRATTSSPSPAPRSRIGRRRASGGKHAGADTDLELPRVDGAAEAGAQSVRRRARTARHARRRQIVGRAARRRLLPRQGAGDVCPRDEAAQRRDRRPGSEPARRR